MSLAAMIIVLLCEAGCGASHPISTGKIIYYNPPCKYEAYATQDDQGVFDVVKTKGLLHLEPPKPGLTPKERDQFVAAIDRIRAPVERNLIPEGATISGDLTGYFQRTIHADSVKVYNWNSPHSYDVRVDIQYHATDRKDALRYVKELGC